MRIRQLPISVANQIAAGEVIERPASVVKELLENALDAKADVITIEIGFGGLNQIKISDNGIGILGEDLPLAIAAHATSKISQLKDLYAITSMGFRGEALASISSISKLIISSKPAIQEHAMRLSTEGGGAIQLEPCARSQGTTIEVNDIFFNAPVRKKFLKSERSEFQAIEMVVKRFALSAPMITIHLSHNGKIYLNLPAAHSEQARRQRIRKILGKTFLEKSHYILVEHANMTLEGWVSTEDYQLSQSDKLWIYLNSRMVKDKLLNHAVKQAYESVLHPGRYPACLLYLCIDSAQVDVNVHPTKHEVRFQQPRLIHDFISSQIQQVLTVPKADFDFPDKARDEKHFFSQVREPYSPPPLVNPVTETHTWFILNASYILLMMHQEPHLIDMVRVQRSWLWSLLKEQSFPLASRPLLVPINFSVKRLAAHQITAIIDVLGQIGIELDWVSEGKVLIRSLPRLIPNLELKPFLTMVFNAPLAKASKLLESLTLYQSFNTYNTSREDMEKLIQYLQRLPLEKRQSWCKHLSLETCQELINA